MIDKLKKGSNLSITSSNDGSPSISYDFVVLDGNVVGIGIFLGDNKKCLSAIIKNQKGERIVVDELVSEHPEDKTAKAELERVYSLYF